MLARECHFYSGQKRNEHIITVHGVKNALFAELHDRLEAGAASTTAFKWPEHGHFNTMIVAGTKALKEMESCATAPIRKLNGDEICVR